MEPLRKRPAAKPAVRGNDLARIHILKKDARLTDDEYRDLLQTLTGKRSAADLSFEQRARVCTHLTTLARKLNPQAAGLKRAKLTPQQSKVFAMWKAIEKTGVLRDGEYKGLRAFVATHTGRSDLRFCDGEACNKLIDELRGWGNRVGANFKERG